MAINVREVLQFLNKISITAIICLSWTCLNAQYIGFTDPAFAVQIQARYPDIYRADTLGGAMDTTKAKVSTNTKLSLINQGFQNADEVRYFEKLDTLNLSNNSLPKINSFIGLGNIKYLNLADNQLTGLTNIGKLTNAQHITVANNQLTRITANFDKLSGTLRRMNFSNNNIDSISADFTKYTTIDWLIIDNNYLSFSDILPLTKAVHFNANDVFPQKALPLSFTKINVLEGKQITISTPYDQNVSGMTFKLYQDGALLLSQKTGIFNFVASTESSGKYYIELSNDNLLTTGFQVSTQEFDIEVSPCVALSDFDIKYIDTNYCRIQVKIQNTKSIPNLSFFLVQIF